MSVEKTLLSLLIKRKFTLATAESCSGGLLAHRLTNVPGSSKVFKLGLVLYSNGTKSRLAKVPQKMLITYGAVSEPVAKKLAQGVRKLARTDFGIGITGIAGPGGGTKEKPVGLVFIAVSGPKGTPCLRRVFRGNRPAIKKQAASLALKFLFNLIKK